MTATGRDATADDAGACAAVRSPCVRETAVSVEDDGPPAELR